LPTDKIIVMGLETRFWLWHIVCFKWYYNSNY